MDVEDMSNSLAENFTLHEASANSTKSLFYETDILELHLYAVSFVVGFPLNAYVIWLIVKETEHGFASEFFNLNLSACELFFSANSLIVFFTKWFALSILQALSQFFLGLAITGCPLFQCLICVERYLAVVHPVTFLKYKPLRYRVICCAVVWIITLSSCIICAFVHLTLTLCMYMWFLSIQFIIFISIKLFCCLAVLKALRQSGPGKRIREGEEENHIKRRAFIVILITTVNTVITYVPFAVTVLISALTEQFFPFLLSLSYACFILAGFVPVVHYLHRTGKLRCLCICETLS